MHSNNNINNTLYIQRERIQETENVIRDVRPKLVKTWETVDQLMNDLKGYQIPEDDDKNKNQNDKEKKQTLMEKTRQYLENAEPLVND